MKLSVRVHAGTRIESVVEVESMTFDVHVRAVPENGKANERVCELIAKHLNISKRKVAVIRGHKSKNKIIEVAD